MKDYLLLSLFEIKLGLKLPGKSKILDFQNHYRCNCDSQSKRPLRLLLLDALVGPSRLSNDHVDSCLNTPCVSILCEHTVLSSLQSPRHLKMPKSQNYVFRNWTISCPDAFVSRLLEVLLCDCDNISVFLKLFHPHHASQTFHHFKLLILFAVF